MPTSHSSPTAPDTTSRRPARICMPTFFSFANQAFRAGMREAQDVLASCDDVDLIELQAAPGFRRREHWLTHLTFHDPFRWAALRNPGLVPVRLQQDYDIFILACPYWRDTWYANAIEGWHDRCRLKICWIDELWSKEVPDLDGWMSLLDRFDYLFFGIAGTSETVTQVTGRAAHTIPGAVDTLRFSPVHHVPERTIDILSIGRRVQSMHVAATELATQQNLFYLHDTLQTGNSPATDYRAHRAMYANMAKRSRLFMVAPGKVDMRHQTAGQTDIGFRCFEGAAAGAVLVGHPPDCPLFSELFDWPDAVVRVQPDGADTAGVVSTLLADPDRLQRVSHHNVAESLRRHDWVHRWRDIFECAGIAPRPAMADRIRLLSTLAEPFDAVGRA